MFASSGSSPSSVKKSKKNKDKDDDDTSDEEREWLDALEKGILDDNGEVKKEKDISLLTARQVSFCKVAQAQTRAHVIGITNQAVLPVHFK